MSLYFKGITILGMKNYKRAGDAGFQYALKLYYSKTKNMMKPLLCLEAQILNFLGRRAPGAGTPSKSLPVV